MNTREDIIKREIRHLEKVLSVKPTISIQVNIEPAPTNCIYDTHLRVDYCFPKIADPIFEDSFDSFYTIELELLDHIDYDFKYLEIYECRLGDKVSSNNIDSDKLKYLPYMDQIMKFVEIHVRYKIARLKRDLAKSIVL